VIIEYMLILLSQLGWRADLAIDWGTPTPAGIQAALSGNTRGWVLLTKDSFQALVPPPRSPFEA